MKNAKLLFLLLLPLLLIGCINYSEETWIHSDGSGKIAMEISTSEQFAALMAGQSGSDPFSPKELAQPFKGVKGIQLKNVKTFHKNGNIIAAVNFEFSSLDAFNRIKNGSSSPGFLGQISLSKDKKGRFIFTRTIDKMELSQGKEKGEADSNDNLAGNMSAALLSGYTWKYTVHFPAKVLNANTANDNINGQTNTVTWDLPLSDIVKSPQTMTATFEAPLPWLTILLIAAGFLIIIAVVFIVLKFVKKPVSI
jgi:lipopolysaccharide export LptBFGC system permease protein LptF